MDKNSKSSDSLYALAGFALSHSKIVQKVSRIANYNDDPKVFTYVAYYKTRNKNNSHSSSGTSFNQKKALIKALGEAIERYCLDSVDKKNLITASVSELNTPHLDPFNIPSFSKNQLSKKSFKQFIFTKNTKFRWVQGYSDTGQKKVLIPAQLVYTSYTPLPNEPYIRFPISTGGAAHRSFNQALYTGICEIIERDSFMIHYLNKLSAPIVDIQKMQSKSLRQILSILERYKLKLTVFDMTTDLHVPVYMAILLDKTGNGPAVSVGLKAGFHVVDSLIGAIEESLMVRTWVRDKFIYGDNPFEMPKTIKTIDQRAYFWLKPNAIEYLKFLFESKQDKKVEILSIDNEDYLSKVTSLLNKTGLHIYYVDITQKEIKKAGFTVLKVFVPELYPLYFDEEYPYLGLSRLYQVPVTLGVFPKPKSESEFNRIPHPVL